MKKMYDYLGKKNVIITMRPEEMNKKKKQGD